MASGLDYSGFANFGQGLVGLFAQQEQSRNNILAQQANRDAGLLAMQMQRETLAAAAADKREDRLAEERAAQRISLLEQEKSAFDRFNQSVALQLQMADREQEKQDKAFNQSMQMMQFQLGSQVKYQQLKRVESEATAMENMGNISDLRNRIRAGIIGRDYGEVSEATQALQALTRNPWYGYIDTELQQNINNSVMLGLDVSTGVNRINNYSQYKVGDLPEDVGSSMGGSIAPEQLQTLGMIRSLMTEKDGKMDASDLPNITGGLKKMLGEENASKIMNRWFGSSLDNPEKYDAEKVEATISRLEHAPDRPLTMDEIVAYNDRARVYEQMIHAVNSGAVNIPHEDRAAFQDLIREAKVREFYTAQGEMFPTEAAAKHSTLSRSAIVRKLIDYNYSDEGYDVTNEDTILPSEQLYAVSVKEAVKEGITFEFKRDAAGNPIPFRSVDYGLVYDSDLRIVEYKSPEWYTAAEKGVLRRAARFKVDKATGTVKHSGDVGGPWFNSMERAPGLTAGQNRGINQLMERAEEFGKSFSGGAASTEPFGTAVTPEMHLEALGTITKQIHDSGDTGLRNGNPGLVSQLNVRDFVPTVYARQSDLAVSMLRRKGIRPGSPDFSQRYLEEIRNTSDPMYIFSFYAQQSAQAQLDRVAQLQGAAGLQGGGGGGGRQLFGGGDRQLFGGGSGGYLPAGSPAPAE